MKRIASVAVLGFAVVWSVGQSAPALAQDLQNSLVDIAYVEPTNADYRPIYERLKKRKVLEELRLFLSPLRLPKKVLAKIEQCNQPGRPYQPGGTVTICYEYIAQLEKLAEKIPADSRTARGVARDDAVVGAFVQVVLHEMSHAVFDTMGVPIWGREDDAADKLAAFLMLQFGTDTARKLLNGAAYFFEASDRTWTGSDFSDTKGTEAQRFYNYLCMAYGGDPKAFKDFVDTGQGTQKSGPRGPVRLDILPAERTAWCPKEYNDLRWAFDSTIMPNVDQDLLKKVLARNWLQPGDGK